VYVITLESHDALQEHGREHIRTKTGSKAEYASKHLIKLLQRA